MKGGRSFPESEGIKKARTSAQMTAWVLQKLLEQAGIEWSFVRGEVNVQGLPVIAMGRVDEKTARELAIFLQMSLKGPRGLLCGEEATLMNESEDDQR